MEWIIGGYIAVGIVKALKKLGADRPDQPIWMYSQRNPVAWSLAFLAYVLVWPLARG